MSESILKERGHALISQIEVEGLTKSFDRLPRDPFIEGNFRFRRLSRFIAPNGQLRALPHKNFMQTEYYNHLLGNIRREYQEMEADVALSDAFIQLLDSIAKSLAVDLKTSVFGAHQIRITAENGRGGEPAPEGIHKDGFDFVTVTCINRQGVVGGKTELYENKENAPVFSEILNPGQTLLCDDRKLFHFTTPVSLEEGLDYGTRDVIVVTVKTGVSLN